LIILESFECGFSIESRNFFAFSASFFLSEAVLRGVPTLSYNGVPNHDEKYLVKLGMLPRAESLSKIILVTHKLLNSDIKKLKLKAKKFLDSMENPHSKLSKIIK